MAKPLPKGWKRTRLSDIAEVNPKSQKIASTEKVAFVAMTDVSTDGSLIRETDRLASDVTSGMTQFQAGDTLLAKITPCFENGKGAFISTLSRNYGFGSTEFHIIRPRTLVHPNYLFWLTRQTRFRKLGVQNMTGSAGQRRVPSEFLKSFPVPLPPRLAQEKISEILGSVDAALAATRRVIEQTHTVRRALLQELLTKGIPDRHSRFKSSPLGLIPIDWELRTLGELSALITSGSRGWARYFADNGSLFLRSQNIRSGYLDLRDRQFVTVPNGAEGNRTLVTLNDLLFTITGNSVGNVAWVSESLGKAYVSQHIALVRLSDPQLAELTAVFFSPDGPGNAQVLRAQYGQSKPGLNLKNLRDLMIPIPPVSEAKRITEMVLQFSTLSDQTEKELQSLVTVRAALLAGLLSGKILVSIPDSNAVQEVVHG